MDLEKKRIKIEKKNYILLTSKFNKITDEISNIIYSKKKYKKTPKNLWFKLVLLNATWKKNRNKWKQIKYYNEWDNEIKTTIKEFKN
tara:strand:+ start:1268 stop:1528 length:261 start_codon:yes stop_codon:yes gene_type:complete